MLHKMIGVKEGIELKEYKCLQAFLKSKTVGHQRKKASLFTRENIELFLREADDEQWLH